MAHHPMFGFYRSRMIHRTAYRMKSHPYPDNEGRWVYHMPDGQPIFFDATGVPVMGDWIIYNTDDDIYHCTDAEFRRRNHVPEVD